MYIVTIIKIQANGETYFTRSIYCFLITISMFIIQFYLRNILKWFSIGVKFKKIKKAPSLFKKQIKYENRQAKYAK